MLVVTREDVRVAIARAFGRARPTGADLVVAALRHGARPEVVESLQALPKDERFADPQTVWEAIGLDREPR